MIERFATWATRWTGSTSAFILAAGSIVLWFASGPFFHWSDTWQLIANTFTTLVTFMMVFLIQRSQNKDSMAVQLKLNELVAAIDAASDRLIDIEDLNEAELQVLHRHYQRMAEMSKEHGIDDSHSLEEAEARHERKHRRVK